MSNNISTESSTKPEENWTVVKSKRSYKKKIPTINENEDDNPPNNSTNIQSTKERSESPKPYDRPQKQLPIWKLYKPKYLLLIKLCSECQDAMFESKKKFFRADNRLHMAVGFCEECLEVNIGLTDLLAPRRV
jgi:hypothetical protein